MIDTAQSAALHIREGAIIELSDSYADYFQKNLITMRAENRLGLAVYLPASIISGLLITP